MFHPKLTAAVVLLIVAFAAPWVFGPVAHAADTMVFQENFNTPAALGQFNSVYGSKFDNYDGWTDTSGHGTYSTAKTLSVSNGQLNINLHSERVNNQWKHYVAALLPKWPCAENPNGCHSLAYAYVGVQFSSDPVPGYKTAWLMWPDSNVWPQGGEIDFPESCNDLTGPICFATHAAQADPAAVAIGTTSTTYTGQHLAEFTMTPTGVNYWLDGVFRGKHKAEPGYPSPGGPSDLMHYVLQTETATNGTTPSNTAQGVVKVNGIEMWSLDGVNDDVRPGY